MKKLLSFILVFTLTSAFAEFNEDFTNTPYLCYHNNDIYAIANPICPLFDGDNHNHYDIATTTIKMSIAYDDNGIILKKSDDDPTDLKCIIKKENGQI